MSVRAHPLDEFSGVTALFEKAKKHLRFPKNAVQLEDGSPIELGLAELSKAPGTVTVTDGSPYGANEWYGRVTSAGTGKPGPKAEPSKNNSVVLYRRGRCPRVA